MPGEPRTEAGRKLLDTWWPKGSRGPGGHEWRGPVAKAIAAIEAEAAALAISRAMDQDGYVAAAINPEVLARALQLHNSDFYGEPDSFDSTRAVAENIKRHYDRIAKEGTPT